MNETIKLRDRHKQEFHKLVHEAIPNVISSNSKTISDIYRIDYVPFPINLEEVIKKDSTIYTLAKVNVTVTNLKTEDSINYIADVLNLPVYQEQGFYIRGNYMQVLDMYLRTPGWSFTNKNKDEITSYFGDLNSVNGKQISFMYGKKGIIEVKFGKSTSSQTVSVSTFFRALTDLSNDDLLVKFGEDNPFVIQAFSDNKKAIKENTKDGISPTRSTCIKNVWLASNPNNGRGNSKIVRNVQHMLKDIKITIMSTRNFDLGAGNSKRLDNIQSFKYRALGKILAEDISIGSLEIKQGTILNEEMLDDLDNMDITELPVLLNDKIYKLKKFSTFTFRALGKILLDDVEELDLKSGTVLDKDHLELLNKSEITSITIRDKVTNETKVLNRRLSARTLTTEDLFTAFSIFLDNLNGYDAYDNIYELTNKISVPYQERAISILDQNMKAITRNISTRLEMIDSNESMITILDDSFKGINKEEFIKSISINTDTTDSTESQRADMTNIMANITKSFRTTSDIPAKASTPQTIQVQDTQSGRTDSLDSPESKNIGLTHIRTVTAKQDENNALTAPYLRVKNGKVVSEEFVYLTSSEEHGKYIAEWNETFTTIDADGNEVPKTSVLARHNGQIVSTEVENISYKQISQLAEMSPARSCIPFQDHCMMKRLLMGCNHQKQANISIKSKRPLVNAGGESILDTGKYSARDVLEKFYDNNCEVFQGLKLIRDKLLNSKLTLVEVMEEGTGRTLLFDIEELKNNEVGLPNQCELIIPYHLPNDEKTMFSYNINTKNGLSYQGDAIVAHYSGYAVDTPEVITRVDFGSLKYDDKVFKNGMALGINPIIAFKTFEGGSIDDAICVSDEIVFDDTLTTISIIKVKKELFRSSTESETFGRDNYKRNGSKHIKFNGLPKIGAILKPGDPYCSVLSTKDNKTTTKYSYLGTYEEGQVVSAFIGEKDGKEYAEIYLASRSLGEVGDKMSGRHGNKGVIARIIPAHEMPFDPVSGKRAQLILSPLGIPSRMNLGVVLESVLAMAVMKSGKDVVSVISPFTGNDIEFVKEMAIKYDVKPIPLIDGRTGKFFERPINLGSLHMYMLIHKVKKKIHSIGFDSAVDPTFLQPKRGSKVGGGQSFGEMETWCMHHMGVDKVLQDLTSFQSDDFTGGKIVDQLLQENPYEVSYNGTNNNNFPTQALFRVLGMDIQENVEMDSYEMKPLTDETIRKLSAKPITSDKELHSIDIFGSNSKTADKDINRGKWGWIDLDCKIVHPTWVRKGSIGKFFTHYENRLIHGDIVQSKVQTTSTLIEEIIKGRFYVDTFYKVGNIITDGEDKIKEIDTSTIKIYAATNEFRFGRKTKNNTNIMEEDLDKEREFSENDSLNLALDYLDGVDDQEFSDDFEANIEYGGSSKDAVPKFDVLDNMSDEVKERSLTGMAAIAWILENYNVNDTIAMLEKRKQNRIENVYEPLGENASYSDNSYIEILRSLNSLKTFVEKDRKLSDFIITGFPVLPEIYRPDMSNTGIKEIADFDWYYTNILNETAKYKLNKSTTNAYAIYFAIANLCGLLSSQEIPRNVKYKNILNWFTGKDQNDDKGKIREALQSKIIKASGRSVIVPMENTDWHPTVLGVPYSMCLNIYKSGIIGHLINTLTPLDEDNDYEDLINKLRFIKRAVWKDLLTALGTNNLLSFRKIYKRNFSKLFEKKMSSASKDNAYVTSTENAFFMFNKWIKQYINGDKELGLEPQIIIAGRQPSLHEFSIRAFYVRCVEGKAIHIHALVCKGYNADFDGDTMWLAGIFTKEAKIQAMEKMSTRHSYINPKNSEIILEVSQDIVLGLYNLTMLKDNATKLSENALENIQFYSDINRLYLDIDSMDLHTYDIVCYDRDGSRYLSTAGRILLNSYLPNGFTDKPFTNTLGFEGIKTELYRELRVDALLSSGDFKSEDFRYQSIKSLLKDIYEEMREKTIDVFQDLTKIGFRICDIHSVSISLEDFEIQSFKDLILAGAEVTKLKIEKDFNNGLIAPEDKKQALINLYSKKDHHSKEFIDSIFARVRKIRSSVDNGLTSKEDGDKAIINIFSEVKGGINELVKNEVINALDRNNNLFIMMDSGARGNSSNIMIAIGAIGVLQKSNSETLETSVTSNYFEGISTFDCYLVSFSTRTAVASTQNETQKAGAATRTAVYMTSGLTIVEKDCGKEDWWYDIQWQDRRPELDVLIPNSKWAEQNLVGYAPNPDHEFTVKVTKDCLDSNGLITDKVLDNLKDGIHELSIIKTINGENIVYPIVISNETMLGTTLLDPDLVYKTSKICEDAEINNNVLKYTQDNHLMEVETSLGKFIFRYQIARSCASLIAHREARNLKGLKSVYTPKLDAEINVITSDTLKQISEEGISRVEVRVFLDCHSHNGICSHCFGLEYATGELPEIGRAVGIESAQSLGEPAAQLTMNLGHTMGQAGASVASGVEVFNAALGGKQLGGGALLSPVSGFVSIKRLDSQIALSIDVKDTECSTCSVCKINNKLDECPLTLGKDVVNSSGTPYKHICNIKDKIDRNVLSVIDGQWVEKGDPLTIHSINPDDIVAVRGNEDMKTVVRRKQQVWLSFYFDTFYANNISINARHFETLARMQNFLVTVVKSENPKFKEGQTYEYSEVLGEKDIKFVSKLSKQKDVFLNYGGALTLITHSNFAQRAASLCRDYYVAERSKSKSAIGRLTIGENLDIKGIKTFDKGIVEIIEHTEEDIDMILDNVFSMEEITSSSGDFLNLDDEDNIFGDLNDINFDILDKGLDSIIDIKDMDVFEDSVITSKTEEQDYNNMESLSGEEGTLGTTEPTEIIEETEEKFKIDTLADMEI